MLSTFQPAGFCLCFLVFVLLDAASAYLSGSLLHKATQHIPANCRLASCSGLKLRNAPVHIAYMQVAGSGASGGSKNAEVGNMYLTTSCCRSIFFSLRGFIVLINIALIFVNPLQVTLGKYTGLTIPVTKEPVPEAEIQKVLYHSAYHAWSYPF
jgi:hypothetical protein